MSRIPRFIGYAMMAAAALLAAAMRQAKIDAIGPVPVVAAVLFIGMTGAMLVFTDLMVRGLYAQINAAREAPHEEKEKGHDEI